MLTEKAFNLSELIFPASVCLNKHANIYARLAKSTDIEHFHIRCLGPSRLVCSDSNTVGQSALVHRTCTDPIELTIPGTSSGMIRNKC